MRIMTRKTGKEGGAAAQARYHGTAGSCRASLASKARSSPDGDVHKASLQVKLRRERAASWWRPRRAMRRAGTHVLHAHHLAAPAEPVSCTHPQHAVKQVPRHAIVEAQLPLQTSRKEGGEGMAGGDEPCVPAARRQRQRPGPAAPTFARPAHRSNLFMGLSLSDQLAVAALGGWRACRSLAHRGWLCGWLWGGGPASPASKDEMQVEKGVPGARI